MELFSGFIIGLAGSFHCVGMCGPIAMSLPSHSRSRWTFLRGRIIYNSGRIISYSLIGALFGFFGSRIFLFGAQRSLSIAIGVLILISVIVNISGKKHFINYTFFNRIYAGFKNLFGKYYKKNSSGTLLMIGIMNGFLPCGFVYIALSGALMTGEVSSGVIYMILFGLGTIPLMLGISFFGNPDLKLRSYVRKLIPALTIILALLFIARGLNLGIPYISPELNKQNSVNEDLICQ